MKGPRVRKATLFQLERVWSAILRRGLARYAPVLVGLAVVVSALLGQTLYVSAGTQEGVSKNLSAEPVDGGIALNWEARGDQEAAGYRILRRYATDDSQLEVLVEDTGSARTRYIDPSVRPETEYVYRVQPIGPSGVGARSNFARVTTPTLPPVANGRIAEPPSPPPPPADASDATRTWSLLRGAASTTADGIAPTSETFWVVNDLLDKVFAYDRSGATVTYNSAKDWNLHADNTRGQGAWTDGTTLWVLDWDDRKVYAYVLTPGAGETRGDRVTGKEFSLHADNVAPQIAIASDGTTMWSRGF